MYDFLKQMIIFILVNLVLYVNFLAHQKLQDYLKGSDIYYVSYTAQSVPSLNSHIAAAFH